MTAAEYLRGKVGKRMGKESKKFRVWVAASPFQFSMTATTIYEAYEAIKAARMQFNLEMDMDEVMETLVMMKNGDRLGTHTFQYGIEVISE